MPHAKIELNVTPEWARAQGASEPESGITSAGGLPTRWEALRTVKTHDASRQPLAKFVELSRRKLRMTVEQLAEKADVDLAELLAVESAEDIVPEPRTIFQLSQVLHVEPEPLMELAGLVTTRDSRIGEAGMRFAARSEPMAALSPEEEAALNDFIKEMSKRPKA